LRTRTPDSHLQILPVPPEGPPNPYLPLGAYPADSSPPSSSEESVGEENDRDKRDTDESIEEEEKGVEDNIGNCVTVLKLSNGVMFRVPVEVQGMQLQAVVDTAAHSHD
jgi:hypothetical protein